LTESVDTTGAYVDSQKPSGAQCGALGTLSNNDADLAALLQAWPSLTDSDRRAIMAIIEAARGQGR